MCCTEELVWLSGWFSWLLGMILGLGWPNAVPQYEEQFLESWLVLCLFACLLAFIVVIVLVLCLLSGALRDTIEMFSHEFNGQENLILPVNMKMTRSCAAGKRGHPLTSEKRTQIGDCEWKIQIGNGLTTDKLGLWCEVISNLPRISKDNLYFPICRNSEQYLEQASQRGNQ